MTDKKQPEALRLAEYFEIFTKSSHRCPDGRPIHIAAAAEFRRLHAENSNLHAQLDAVGAGGVGAMLPRHAQPAPAMPVPWVPGPNEFKDWCSRWFGPDADDSYLAKAAFDLPPTAQQFERPAAPQPQQIAAPEPSFYMDDDCAAGFARGDNGGAWVTTVAGGTKNTPLYLTPPPQIAEPAGNATPSACSGCGGTGIVDDGEITGSGGVLFESGPIKCVKDCPDCAPPRPTVASSAMIARLRENHVTWRDTIDRCAEAADLLEVMAQQPQQIAEPAVVGPADRHLPQNVAELLIDYFLRDELGVKCAPSTTLEKQGEDESETHIWAFWIEENDTTSYLGEDGRIQWFGTAWTPDTPRPQQITEPAPELVEPVAIVAVSPGHVSVGWMGGYVPKHNDKLYAAPLPHQIAEPASHAVKDVLAERQRQINVEGWTPELDDDRVDGQMAGAASCYAQHVNARSWVATDLDNGPEIYRTEPTPDNWPWDESWWKPTTPRRDAVKACALLLAEIERIDRATNHKEQS